VRRRLLPLAVVAAILVLSSSEWPPALGQASHLRSPATPGAQSAQALKLAAPKPAAPIREPEAGSSLRWLLPLALVAGLFGLGAAIALIRAADGLRPRPLRRGGAADTRTFVNASGPGAHENIRVSLTERLASYGGAPQDRAVGERLVPETEDAAVRDLTEAMQPHFVHAERLIDPAEPPTLYGMATILELAEHADVSAENVLRVVYGEPVSSAVEERVHRAIDELGPPYPGAALEPIPVQATLERTRRQLLETFAETAAELEAKLPKGVGSVVYEALRVEVRPVTTQLGQMAELVEALLEHVRQTEAEIVRERKERLDDLALVTQLIMTGWRTVDRRLGRLERMLEDRHAADRGDQQVTRNVYLDNPPRPSE
jgi:hypothetical protein